MHDDFLEHGHFTGGGVIFGPLPDDDFPVNPDWLRLTSVGIDIGSSTSHLIFSKLIMRRKSIENSSEFEVVFRQVLYRSPILLTPYSNPSTIDTEALAAFVRKSYEESGITPDAVDTGAVICTGEAVRKHNSESIIRMLSVEGGRFVCATAGPNLEGILGAHGSGAVARSRTTGAGMNVDVGGGTSKIAIVQDGEVVEVMAINVGARLIAWDGDNRIVRIEEAGRRIAAAAGQPLGLGDTIHEEQKRAVAEKSADILFEALRRGKLSPVTGGLIISGPLEYAGPLNEISFSGGVAEYVYDCERQEYGDFGPLLGAAVRERLAGLGIPLTGSAERIRATVIGASQYTVQVSTSTIFVSRPGLLPLLDLQVAPARLPDPALLTGEAVEQGISRALERLDLAYRDGRIALALIGPVVPTYDSIRALCDGIARALPVIPDQPWVIILTADVAGLVGFMLKREYQGTPEVIVVDGIHVGELNFVDLGEPLDSVEAVPVVVKSLVFDR
jgi:ethanolamine utilization protein EutA